MGIEAADVSIKKIARTLTIHTLYWLFCSPRHSHEIPSAKPGFNVIHPLKCRTSNLAEERTLLRLPFEFIGQGPSDLNDNSAVYSSGIYDSEIHDYLEADEDEAARQSSKYSELL